MGLGNALCRKGKCDDALTAYRKAIELDPSLSIGYMGVGNVLTYQGDLEGAVGAYRKAIELDPCFGFAYNGLGNALSRQGQLDEAAAAYRRAIELDPEPNAHIGLAKVAWALANHQDPEVRDLKRAVELGKEAVAVAPQWDVGWQFLGWIEYRAGNWKASVEALDRSCKLQAGGAGDCFQWTVLALAHARLAAEKELPAEERARHQGEARRWYEQADKIITSRWQVRPADSLEQAVWDFHAEATEWMNAQDNEK
jgi:tetratricopeptide (TPR) repeat protein